SAPPIRGSLGTCVKGLRIQARGGAAKPRRASGASSIEPGRVSVPVIDADRGAAIAGEGRWRQGAAAEHRGMDKQWRLAATPGQNASDDVGNVVMRLRRMIDDVAAGAATSAPFEAAQLVDGGGMIEKVDAAAVQ